MLNKNTNTNKKRKVAIIAGSRGEYGYFRPVIKEIENREDMDYSIIATNMHVLDSFGSSIEEIKRDQLKIHASVYNTFDGYNQITMVKSLSVFMLQLPELLKQMEADMILLAGDRGEQLIGAITGAHMYIPVAHIQAGEISGNIDGVTRHAITKFSHIHFAANEDAAERVLKMGEEPHRVHNVGAPMLDELVSGFWASEDETYGKFSLDKNKPVVLLAYHSVTEEFGEAEAQINNVINAVSSFGHQTVVILNNSDAGSSVIRRAIMKGKKPFMHIVSNMKRQDYAGLLNIADVIIGNSSSGIIEAPTFKLPAVNIGNRQWGRMRSTNVIDVDYDTESIKRAIGNAMSSDFKNKVKKCVNPYGDGRSAKRIVDVLSDLNIDDTLLIKRMTY